MIKVKVIGEPIVKVKLLSAGGGGDTPYYTGEYEATPNSTEQIFETNGKKMTDNFVIHKIPNNYGLITYSGNSITVS